MDFPVNDNDDELLFDDEEEVLKVYGEILPRSSDSSQSSQSSRGSFEISADEELLLQNWERNDTIEMINNKKKSSTCF